MQKKILKNTLLKCTKTRRLKTTQKIEESSDKKAPRETALQIFQYLSRQKASLPQRTRLVGYISAETFLARVINVGEKFA